MLLLAVTLVCATSSAPPREDCGFAPGRYEWLAGWRLRAEDGTITERWTRCRLVEGMSIVLGAEDTDPETRIRLDVYPPCGGADPEAWTRTRIEAVTKRLREQGIPASAITSQTLVCDATNPRVDAVVVSVPYSERGQ